MSEFDNNLPIVAIVGTGNVATHLSRAFADKVNLFSVNPHTFEGLPQHADIVIISVKDSAIGKVVSNLPKIYDIVVHTSGSVPINILAECGASYGVFYPLQTFSKDVPLIYSDIPFFIEGDSVKTVAKLLNLAKLVSENVHEADSSSRKRLHLASVFACNFSNCLVGIADKILHECDMDYRVLLPLLNQTVSKLNKLSPEKAQTGPASRRDFQIIDSHIRLLQNNGHDDWANIYNLLSNEIINNGL